MRFLLLLILGSLAPTLAFAEQSGQSTLPDFAAPIQLMTTLGLAGINESSDQVEARLRSNVTVPDRTPVVHVKIAYEPGSCVDASDPDQAVLFPMFNNHNPDSGIMSMIQWQHYPLQTDPLRQYELKSQPQLGKDLNKWFSIADHGAIQIMRAGDFNANTGGNLDIRIARHLGVTSRPDYYPTFQVLIEKQKDGHWAIKYNGRNGWAELATIDVRVEKAKWSGGITHYVLRDKDGNSMLEGSNVNGTSSREDNDDPASLAQ